MAKIDEIVIRLQQAVRDLEQIYPGRRFTLDGHLVGSIGEAIARERYGLKLLPSSSARHDAVCPANRCVQIKMTQVDRISIYSEPDYLIVLCLNPDGSTPEAYNGPGEKPWSAAGKVQKNGQRSISLSRLRDLQNRVEKENMIVEISSSARDEGKFSLE